MNARFICLNASLCRFSPLVMWLVYGIWWNGLDPTASTAGGEWRKKTKVSRSCRLRSLKFPASLTEEEKTLFCSSDTRLLSTSLSASFPASWSIWRSWWYWLSSRQDDAHLVVLATFRNSLETFLTWFGFVRVVYNIETCEQIVYAAFRLKEHSFLANWLKCKVLHIITIIIKQYQTLEGNNSSSNYLLIGLFWSFLHV